MKPKYELCVICNHRVILDAPSNGIVLSCDFILDKSYNKILVRDFIPQEINQWNVFFYIGPDSNWIPIPNNTPISHLSAASVPEKCPYFLEHVIS